MSSLSHLNAVLPAGTVNGIETRAPVSQRRVESFEVVRGACVNEV